MNVSRLAPYAKAVVAVAGAVVVTANAVLDGQLDANDWTAIVAAWATAYGVFRVTNAKQ